MSKTILPDLQLIQLSDVMKALSDPIRLGLFRLLSDDQERGWGELQVPVAKSTLSYHLKILRSAGITITREDGNHCYVKLRREELESRFPGLCNIILKLIENSSEGKEVGLKN